MDINTDNENLKNFVKELYSIIKYTYDNKDLHYYFNNYEQQTKYKATPISKTTQKYCFFNILI